MEDTLISFETAKLAKEKGFNWKVNNYFQLKTISGGVFEEYLEDSNQDINSDFPQNALFSRPTQSKLQAWLREKHTIIVLVGLKESSLSLYTPTIQYVASKTTSLIAHFPTHFKTYDEALELGLLEGLKRIK